MESAQKQTKTLLYEDQLLESIDPSTLGCIWLSDSKLNERERPLTWFNYIFDGVIESQLVSIDCNQKTSFFVTKSFNQKFYLIHSLCKNLDSPQNIADQIKLMGQEADGPTRVLLLSKNSKVFKESELKKFSSIEFQKLIY